MDYEESDYDEDYGDDSDYFDNELDDDFGDDDGESETIPCPECGAEIYEDAEACPQCGEYIHHGYSAGYGSPWWSFGGVAKDWSPLWILLAMAGVISTIFVLMVLA